MVIVQVINGLGNQMFQYAMGRRLAHIHNVPLKLDIAWFEKNGLRTYGLNHFNIIENYATMNEIEYVKNCCYFEERHFHFNPETMNLPSTVYLEGYWQSEKYFKEIEELIRHEFTLKQKLDEKNEQMAEQIRNCESVSLHIRRGDFVQDPMRQEFHGVCPLEYYYQAAKELADGLEKPHFFIFTDDPQWSLWALEVIKINYSVTFVTINGADDCHKDLYLMSLCKHHITANSSFSWWGAWLAQYPNKQVYVPEKWVSNGQISTHDLILDAWHRR